MQSYLEDDLQVGGHHIALQGVPRGTLLGGPKEGQQMKLIKMGNTQEAAVGSRAGGDQTPWDPFPVLVQGPGASSPGWSPCGQVSVAPLIPPVPLCGRHHPPPVVICSFSYASARPGICAKLDWLADECVEQSPRRGPRLQSPQAGSLGSGRCFHVESQTAYLPEPPEDPLMPSSPVLPRVSSHDCQSPTWNLRWTNLSSPTSQMYWTAWLPLSLLPRL